MSDTERRDLERQAAAGDLAAAAKLVRANERDGIGFRPRTDLEVDAMAALEACKFGMFSSRRSRLLTANAIERHGGPLVWSTTITDAQAAVMWSLLWRYRRSVLAPTILLEACRRKCATIDAADSPARMRVIREIRRTIRALAGKDPAHADPGPGTF